MLRLRGLIRKELLQTVRDPSSIAIAFLLPAILLVLFGYGVSLDTENVPIAIVDDTPSAATREFLAGFRNSRYFETFPFLDVRSAEAALLAREVDAILHLRDDFVEDLLGGRQPRVQLVVNGVDANTARIIDGYARGVWVRWIEERSAGRWGAPVPPVTVEQRLWFNREVRSRNFLVPGLVAVIMTLIGSLLTALVMAREWERGSMESLLVTPARMGEILLGKLIPYFLLGSGGLVFTVVMGVWIFDVPLRGSLWVLFGTSALFLLAALGMGLFISTVTKNQFVASQIAILATFLPAFILSGFIFDIRSMPPFIQAITYLVSARYLVSILQTVFLAGDVGSVILPNAAALAGLAALFLGLTRLVSRKRLE
jgi:ABC-2 type transport system permease protein